MYKVYLASLIIKRSKQSAYPNMYTPKGTEKNGKVHMDSKTKKIDLKTYFLGVPQEQPWVIMLGSYINLKL